MPHNVIPPEKSGRPAAGREFFSFDRAGLVTLGFYEPGKTATLNDPAFTGARFPNAIVAHELTHQSLMINTTFGMFTMIINALRKRECASDEVSQTCHEVQWMVQEGVATYAEMAVVAREAPAKLADEIAALPSSRDMQPPYREAFETIAAWLPFDAGDDEPTVRAKEFLVLQLGCAAMNTDCLRRGLAGQPTEKLLFECMADTPDDRFTRLLAAVGRDRGHLILLDKVHRHIVQAMDTANGPANAHGWKAIAFGLKQHLLKLLPQRRGISRTERQFNLSLIKNIRSLSDDAIAWEEEKVFSFEALKAAQRLVEFWRPALPNYYLVPAEEDPLPRVNFPRGTLKHEPPRLPEGAIADFAAKATERNLGIIIKLALRDSSLAHVTLGAYIPERQSEPWPKNLSSKEEAAAIPPDIMGLALPETLLRELKAFPPMVVTLFRDSMRYLAEVPGSKALFRQAIAICELTDLSLEDVEYAVNEYGGRQGFVIRLREPRYLGCIVKKGARAFIIAPMRSDTALSLFGSICGQLKITPVDPDSFVRERDLLQMVGQFG